MFPEHFSVSHKELEETESSVLRVTFVINFAFSNPVKFSKDENGIFCHICRKNYSNN